MNRRFLQRRLLTVQAVDQLSDAIEQLQNYVSADNVFRGRFRHADAKRIVDQFEKETDDITAVVSLLLVDLATTFETFNDVGPDRAVVDHAYATLDRLHKYFSKLEASELAQPVSRFGAVADEWSGAFGYGLSDETDAMANAWRDRVSKIVLPNPTSGKNPASEKDADDDAWG